MRNSRELRSLHHDHTVIRKLIAVVLSVAALFVCYRLIGAASSAGLSRLLSTYALASNQLSAADRAVAITPFDPDAHADRARLLTNLNKQEEAAAEYEVAVKLRPHDYYLWLECGFARDRLGNQEGALKAFLESVSLAPSFSEPRWQLGNLLFRMGQTNEAFTELRRAVATDPSFSTSVFELAWVASGGDGNAFVKYVQPSTPRIHLELAKFMARHDKPTEAVEQVRTAGVISNKDDLDFVKSTIYDLLAAKAFLQAYEVWATTHPNEPLDDHLREIKLINGDFEQSIIRNDPGFGWQLAPETPGVEVAIDPIERRSGFHSIRLQYSGNVSPGLPVLAEWVLARSSGCHILHFSARTQDLVTGGPPIIFVFDVTEKQYRLLGQSKPISALGGGAWQEYTANFVTQRATSALLISVQRQECPTPQCPIFGKLWLDDFYVTAGPPGSSCGP
jgi:tetratricopeptide (TPR) repeat protein